MFRLPKAGIVLVIFLTIWLGCATTAQADPFVFTITNLGTLGGNTSAANGINDSGQVVGVSTIPGGRERAFLYNNGVMQNLGTLGRETSVAYDINNSGQVTGAVYNGDEDFGFAFLYEGGTMQLLPSLPCGPPSRPAPCLSNGYGINNSGQIVGRYLANFGPSEALLYSDGTPQSITPADSIRGVAFNINDSGQVVGFRDSFDDRREAFLYNSASGEQQLLGLGIALGINNSGQVVGCTNAPARIFSGVNCTGQAFLYSDEVRQDLGTLGGTSSAAYSINDSGQVVGVSSIMGGVRHAFLYADNMMLDLNNLIPTGSGWVLSVANDINNLGQIVGTGIFGGQQRAFLLTPFQQQPVPEPTTLLLLGTGLAAVAARVRKRRACGKSIDL